MPRLFDEIELLVDCRAIGSPAEGGGPRVVPRGSRGVLVDRNTMCPHVWTIECAELSSAGIVLVEAEEGAFVVRKSEGTPPE